MDIHSVTGKRAIGPINIGFGMRKAISQNFRMSIRLPSRTNCCSSIASLSTLSAAKAASVSSMRGSVLSSVLAGLEALGMALVAPVNAE